MKMDNNLKSYQTTNKCFLCQSTELKKIFQVNEISLTGIFPKQNEIDPIKTPINLNICKNCDNLQITEIVNKQLMFSDYWYRSGTTKSMYNHFEYVISNIKKVKNDGKLLDIGCNDCTFLEVANREGFDGYGIEPSVAYNDSKVRDVNKIANDFFPTEKKWSLDCDKFDIITAISMFYDVQNPLEFLLQCKKRLVKNGILFIEVNYAKTFLEKKNVDMLGQEHLILYFIKTFEGVLNKAGLYLNDAQKNEMNGGNIIFQCGFEKNKTENLLKLKSEEEKFLKKFEFLKFQDEVDQDLQKLKNKIKELNLAGKTLKIYGASTRGAFICQYLKLSSKYFESAVDVQPNKNHRRIPGTDIKIEMEKEAKQPDVYLILPYQFIEEFVKKNVSFLKKGGTFLSFRPSNFEISMNNKGEIVKTNY